MITEAAYLKHSQTAKRAAMRYGTTDPEECFSYITTAPRFLDLTEETPAGIVYMICKSLATAWYKSEQRRENHINRQFEMAEDERADDYTPWDFITNNDDPRGVEKNIVEREEAILIKQLFSRAHLTDGESLTMDARRYPITNAEIAKLFGKSKSAIDHYSERARNKLMPYIFEAAIKAQYNLNTCRNHPRREARSLDFYHPRGGKT